MDSGDHYALSYEESFNQIRHGHFQIFSHNQIWEVLHNSTLSHMWQHYSEVPSSLLTTVNFNIGCIFLYFTMSIFMLSYTYNE